MIKLEGSDRATSGSSYCATVHGGQGVIRARASIGGKAVPVTIRSTGDLVEICVTLPANSADKVLRVQVMDGSGTKQSLTRFIG